MEWKLQPQKVKVLYLKSLNSGDNTQVLRGTRNLVGIREDHLIRLNTTYRPIAHSRVTERWKEPLLGELNSTWNRVLTIRRRPMIPQGIMVDCVPLEWWTGELLFMASLNPFGVQAQRKRVRMARFSHKEQTRNRSDLSMSKMKRE